MEIPFCLDFPGCFVFCISGKKFQSFGMSGFCSVFGGFSSILMDVLFHPKLGCEIDFCLSFSWGINHPGLEEPQQMAGEDFWDVSTPFYSSVFLLHVSWASSEVGSRINIRKIGISSATGIGNVTLCDRDGGQVSPALRNHLCSPLLLLALFFNFLFTQVLCSWASAPGQFFRV